MSTEKKFTLSAFLLLAALHSILFTVYVIKWTQLGTVVLVVWLASVVYMLRFVIVAFSAYWICGVLTHRCSSYVLPLSFLPLPVIAFILVFALRLGNWWSLLVLRDAASFAFTFFALTLVLAIIMERKKARMKIAGKQLSPEASKKMLIAAAVVSAIFIVGIIALSAAALFFY